MKTHIDAVVTVVAALHVEMAFVNQQRDAMIVPRIVVSVRHCAETDNVQKVRHAITVQEIVADVLHR